MPTVSKVIEVLTAAFTQGRLTKDEFDLRVGTAFAARTCAELAMVTADIPVGLAGAGPVRTPAPAGWRVNKAVMWGAYGLIAPAIFAAAIMPDNSVTWGTLAPISFLCFVGWLIAGIMMLTSWHKKLISADSADASAWRGGVPSPRKPAKARARAAKAAVFGLYGIIMPAVFTVAVIPGDTTVRVVVTTAAVIYFTFWVVGGAVVLATRSAGRGRRQGGGESAATAAETAAKPLDSIR